LSVSRNLNPDRRTLTVLSQQLQQPTKPSRVIGDTGPRDDPTLVIDDGHVMLIF
jgi:hypothetical protein